MALHEFPRHTQFRYVTPPARPATIEQIHVDELSEGMARLLTSCSQMKSGTPEVVVFLDKSGRQLSRLFLTLWRTKFPDTPLPEIRSFNIGREATDEMAKAKVAHVLEEAQQEGTLTHSLADSCKGKRVLVVDDVIRTLSTQQQVNQIFSSDAFAPATFESIALLDAPLLWEDSAALGVVETTYPSEMVSRPFTVSYTRYLDALKLDQHIERELKAVRQHGRRTMSREQLQQLMEERDQLGLFPDLMLDESHAVTDPHTRWQAREQLRRSWDKTALQIAPTIQPSR